jgi:hypothetical protein
MKVRIVCLGASLILGLVCGSSAFAAKIQPVYSLKNLGEHRDAAGKPFTKVQVKCNTGHSLRYIHQDIGKESWCVNGDLAECSLDRIEAATRACTMKKPENYKREPFQVNTAPTAEMIAVQAEREKLQQELIENQEKKIKVRARQLELRKRELELLNQRDAN